MNCKIIEDKNHKEEVLVYVKKIDARAKRIEAFVKEEDKELIGFLGEEIIKLSLEDIYCFTVEGSKILAITENKKIVVKQRLYQIEEILDDRFVKINQSSIANIKKIKKFDASFSGSLIVIFENGYRDYVSRRQVKVVKERIGIK